MSETKVFIDRYVLKELSKPVVLTWVRDMILDWTVMVFAISSVVLMPSIFTVILCVLVVGNRQHGLAILGHEGTHYRISLNRNVNDILSNVFCFWPLGLTASGYRKLHHKHHRESGTEHDPELAHKRSRCPQWDLPASPLRILKYAALDTVGLSIPDYWIIVTYSKPEKNSEYIPLLAWHLVFAIVCVVTGFWWVSLIWYVCLITTFMMSFRLRLWLEHQGTSETHRLHLNPIQGALLAPHNIWLHWEHHKFSSIPYHKLPAVRKYMNDVPVMRLGDLLRFFSEASPSQSGEVFKKTS